MGSRTFLLMGSGEFEPWSFELERAALRRADGDGSVAILPTASALQTGPASRNRRGVACSLPGDSWRAAIQT